MQFLTFGAALSPMNPLQLIQMSNFCQLASIFFSILAIFWEDAREFALLLDILADAITLSVAGCMGAQIEYELKEITPYVMQRE